MVDSPPEVLHLALDADVDLVQVPAPLGVLAHGLNAPLADLGREHWAEAVPTCGPSHGRCRCHARKRNGLSGLGLPAIGPA